MSEASSRSDRPYWVLRVAETALLATALGGIALFAWSLVDIIRIESDPASAGSLPSGSWPGIFIFFGSMIALQVVRMFLQRHRRDDGTPRGGERAAVDVTADALADLPPVGEPAAGVIDDALDA